MIEVNYNDYKRILEENMRLIPENHKLKEEVERLNNKNEELLTLYTTERNVKEDYKTIIKEVREYNEHLIRDAKYHLNEGHLKKIKKILDKVEENK